MKFKASKTQSSVTYLGKEHEVDEDGLVDLPADAAEHIAPHGFTPHVPVTSAELKAKAAEAKAAKDKAAKLVKLGPEKLLKELQDGKFTSAELKAIQTAEADEDANEDVQALLAKLMEDAG
ncbi:MAG: hypothetical protein ACHQ7M_05280 [Chloroflexota bacterium]